MKKFFALSFALMLIFSFVLSAVAKGSFKNFCNDEELQNAADVSSLLESALKETEKESEFSSTAKRLLKADIIVEAELCGKTKWEYRAALCPLKILKVYKGSVKPGEQIDFYETAFFDYEKESGLRFFNSTFFNPISEGKKYIVFANKKEFHPLYEKNLEKKVFVSCGLDVSWFSSEMTTPPILSKGKKYTFGEIKDFEFLCSSKKQRDSINRFKTKVIARLDEKNRSF